MGRTVKRYAPGSCMTVGALIDARVPTYAWCSRCETKRPVDLVALAADKGRDYSLVRKRSHCPVCRGLVAYHATPNPGCWHVNLSEVEG